MGMLIGQASGFVTDHQVKTIGQEGNQVVKISIAVKQGYGDKETTTFVSAYAYSSDRGFKFLSEYVKKGDNLVVSGEQTVRMYEGKNGHGVSIEIHVDRFDRPSKGQREGGDQEQGSQPRAQGAASAQGSQAQGARQPASGQRAPAGQGFQRQPAAQRPPAAGNNRAPAQQTQAPAPVNAGGFDEDQGDGGDSPF